MIDHALTLSLGMFCVALLLTCWRLLAGPDVLDRVLALDTLYVNALAIVILLGIRFRTQVYFEAALVIAMLGFVGTVVTARFVARGNQIARPRLLLLVDEFDGLYCTPASSPALVENVKETLGFL
jgi:multicomponent K+:H+ antiporter subunit F